MSRPDEIRTERLVLRAMRLDDLEAAHAMLSDPRTMTYWPRAPHTSLEQSREWLDLMISAQGEPSYEDWAIERDGRMIGKIGAWRLPDFGYALHPDHWRQGIASEAMAAFLGQVAQRPDLNRLCADIDPRNIASIRLVERFGFRKVGTAERSCHTHMGWCDSAYYEMDRAGLDRCLRSG